MRRGECWGETRHPARFSVRKIEQRVKEDLGFRYLAGGCAPDDVSFNRFRLRHGKVLQRMFTAMTVEMLLAGVTRAGKVVLDSTQVNPDSSGHRHLYQLGNRQVVRWCMYIGVKIQQLLPQARVSAAVEFN